MAQSPGPAFSEVLASFVEPEQRVVFDRRFVAGCHVLDGLDRDQFRTVTMPDELERPHAALSSQR